MTAPQVKGPEIKGWCPGALTPMMSGDGLVVRIRPFNGRLSADQAAGLADLSATHGNGLMDLSSRANLQLRGVTDQSYPALMEGLEALGLLDASPRIEARRNIIVTPFWDAGDDTEALATALTVALASDDAPDLPKKFGFAIDTGPVPVLQSVSADIRLEREPQGGLLIAADGAPVARPITEDAAIDEILTLTHWFLAERGTASRMGKMFDRDGILPEDHFVVRPQQAYEPAPAQVGQGQLVGIAFGQVSAETLAALASHGPLRLTPWRMVLVEGAQDLPDVPGLIADPADPLLRISACTGAPGCDQALIETRPLARRLAKHTPANGILHVSGCAKGCAHPKPAPLTVTGTAQGLSLIRNGRAGDAPDATVPTPDDLLKAI